MLGCCYYLYYCNYYASFSSLFHPLFFLCLSVSLSLSFSPSHHSHPSLSLIPPIPPLSSLPSLPSLFLYPSSLSSLPSLTPPGGHLPIEVHHLADIQRSTSHIKNKHKKHTKNTKNADPAPGRLSKEHLLSVAYTIKNATENSIFTNTYDAYDPVAVDKEVSKILIFIIIHLFLLLYLSLCIIIYCCKKFSHPFSLFHLPFFTLPP